jgi:hypothetical protein
LKRRMIDAHRQARDGPAGSSQKDSQERRLMERGTGNARAPVRFERRDFSQGGRSGSAQLPLR